MVELTATSVTTALIVPLLLLACWMYTAGVVQERYPKLRNKRICLMIAHPDDEAMFFAPTILALTDPSMGNHVKILCLSTGDADGLGETRKLELVKSGMQLGLRKEDDVFVLDSPEFPDSMTETWPKEKIARLLSSAFAPTLGKKTNQHTVTIDALITFDGSGVSAHPNHISLYHGARHFLSLLTGSGASATSPLDLYTLSSVGVVRKYAGVFDALTTLLTAMSGGPADDHPESLVFVASPQQVRVAQQAMTTGHVSQMRWFRWGWIGLSRYMYVNDLQRETAD